MSREGAIAAHRFALGARPGEIAAAAADPCAWLLGQLSGVPPQPDIVPLPGSGALTADLLRTIRARADNKKLLASFEKSRDLFLREMGARFVLGFTTERPFAERLTWFWSNHFVVSAQNPRAIGFCGAFEREAIRPNVAGTFEEMLLAVVRHPGMLIYLDQAQSVGPDSMGGFISGKGLNENLAREILELHTLGVNGGYSQDDVVALAKILTGWSLDRNAAGGRDAFRFYALRHEPGKKVLLGKAYPAGEEGGIAALRDLARHPATARHVARKLAAHFLYDAPPEASVARIAKVFLDTGGDLKALARAVLDDPAAWDPALRKLRPPVEFVTAAMRAFGWWRFASGAPKEAIKRLAEGARDMGQFPFAAPSPKGWPDDSQSWSGPDAVLARVEWAHATAERMAEKPNPSELAADVLGPLLGADTAGTIARAASAAQGLALLLASPEFQRR